MSEGSYLPPPPPGGGDYFPPPPPPPPGAFPPPPPPPPGAAGSQFDFVRPFTYVFEDPNWVSKILLGGLFVLAGIFLVGIFFIYGYAAKLARNVLAGVARPLPEWDDLGGYFSEGLMLFGVVIVYILPLVGLVFAFVIPAVILGAFNGHDAAHAASGAWASCMSCLIFPVSLAYRFWMPAALLRAVVHRRFGAAFEFAEIWNFIRANIGSYVLAFLVQLVANFAAGLGVILFCVGVLFTGFWAMCVGVYAYASAWRLAEQPA